MSLAGGSGNGTGGMEIVGHTQATGTAVKRGDAWVFQTFTGGPVTFDN